MLVAVVILCIILVCAIIAIVVLKADSKFWKDMYRDIFKWSNNVHNSNKEMIESCKEDIEFAHRVIETNEKLLNELKRVEQERHELAVKLLTLENQNEGED